MSDPPPSCRVSLRTREEKEVVVPVTGNLRSHAFWHFCPFFAVSFFMPYPYWSYVHSPRSVDAYEEPPHEKAADPKS